MKKIDSNNRWHEKNDFGGYDCIWGSRQKKRILKDKQTMWNKNYLAFYYILIENNFCHFLFGVGGKRRIFIYKVFDVN